QAKQPDVFTNAREIFLPLPLVLNPKEIDDVSGFEKGGIEVVAHGHAELFKLARHQRARADESDAGTEFQEGENVRARDPAEKNVADNHDVEAGDPAFARANGVDVQQRLGGMLM